MNFEKRAAGKKAQKTPPQRGFREVVTGA